MAYSLVTTVAEAQESGGQCNTASTSFTAGNQLIALVYWWSGTVNLSSVTYDPGGANETAFTAAGSQLSTGVGSVRFHIFYLSNVPTTASKVIRATFSTTGISGGGFMRVLQLSGGDTTDALDDESTATGSSATASTSLTTTSDNSAVFALVSNNAGSDATEDTGYTNLAVSNIGFWESGQYDLDVGSAGAKTVQMTLAGSGGWGIKAAAFKVPGAAGPGDDEIANARQWGAMPSGLLVPRRLRAMGFIANDPLPPRSDMPWAPRFPNVIRIIYAPTPSGQKTGREQ